MRDWKFDCGMYSNSVQANGFQGYNFWCTANKNNLEEKKRLYNLVDAKSEWIIQ